MDLLHTALIVVLALAAGFLGGIYSVRNYETRQRKQAAAARAQRRQAILAGLLGELNDNLSLAKGEFSTDLNDDPLMPAGFVTQWWETHRGEMADLGAASDPVRRAYGAIYHANSVRDYVLHSLSKAFSKSLVDECVRHHKDILKQKVLPALYDAIAQIESRG